MRGVPQEKTVRARRIFLQQPQQSPRLRADVQRLGRRQNPAAESLDPLSVDVFSNRFVADGIGAAIRRVDCHLSNRQMQRIWKRFDLGQSQIRTALWQQGKPPELTKSTHSPAAEVLGSSPSRLSQL